MRRRWGLVDLLKAPGEKFRKEAPYGWVSFRTTLEFAFASQTLTLHQTSASLGSSYKRSGASLNRKIMKNTAFTLSSLMIVAAIFTAWMVPRTEAYCYSFCESSSYYPYNAYGGSSAAYSYSPYSYYVDPYVSTYPYNSYGNSYSYTYPQTYGYGQNYGNYGYSQNQNRAVVYQPPFEWHAYGNLPWNIYPSTSSSGSYGGGYGAPIYHPNYSGYGYDVCRTGMLCW